jgi:sugar phosphate isomerase/epimerase
MFKNLNPLAIGVSGHQSEIIELALTYGFAGIDLNMAEFASRARLKGMPYAKRLIESAKIRIGTFALPLDLDTDDDVFQKDLSKLPELAECAKELGCTCCTTTLAPAGDARPYHENFEFHRRRLHDICGVLKPAGVRLAVGCLAVESLRQNQAFQFVHELDALMLLLNMVAEPNAGLLLDIWEVVAGGGSIESVRKLPREQIVAVQVADMPANVPLPELDEKTSRLLPGGENGRVDVAGFLAVLREKGYDGPVTVKASRNAFQSRRRDVVIKQTSEALGRAINPPPAPVAQPAIRHAAEQSEDVRIDGRL